MTLAASDAGSGRIIITESMRKQATHGVLNILSAPVSLTNVPVSLKLMLEDGELSPPWKSSSVENGNGKKKLLASRLYL